MQYLCWWLSQQLPNDRRTVIDDTGLDRSYDFTSLFARSFHPMLQETACLLRYQTFPRSSTH